MTRTTSRAAKPRCSSRSPSVRAVTTRCIRAERRRVPGVERRRHLPRLPHAEAAHRRCRACGDDRSLHSTSQARARSAGRSQRSRHAHARRLSRRSGALLPAGAAGDAGQRVVCRALRKSSRVPISRPASAGSNRRSRSTGRNARTSITSLRARTRRHRTTRPRFAGLRRHFQRDASFAPALKELATAATAMGRSDEAARALRESRDRCGRRTARRSRISATSFCQQSRIDEAQQSLERALALDPDLPRAEQHDGTDRAEAGTRRYSRSGIFAPRSATSPISRKRRTTLEICWPDRQGVRGSRLPFRESHPQQSELCRSAAQLRAGPGPLSGSYRQSGRRAARRRGADAAVRASPPRSGRCPRDGGSSLRGCARVREWPLQSNSDPEIRRTAEAALRSLRSRGR